MSNKTTTFSLASYYFLSLKEIPNWRGFATRVPLARVCNSCLHIQPNTQNPNSITIIIYPKFIDFRK